jgi:ATP-dependent DNA helicase RecG
MGGTMELLTDRQVEVLRMIQKNPKISVRDIAELLQMNTSAARKHIDALKNKGVIIRIGGTRGHWEIKLKE